MRKIVRRLVTVAAVGSLVFSLLAIGPIQSSVKASSHREAPLITGDPLADNTDVYAFVDPNDPTLVNLIANFIPFQEPAGGPYFYKFDDNVRYDINVDNNGDAVADVSFQLTFVTTIANPNTHLLNTGPINTLRGDPDLNVQQFYTLTLVRPGAGNVVLDTNLPVVPANIGPRSTPNYEALAATGVQSFATPNGVGRSFCGQRDEGFFVDIGSIFDLFGLREGFNTLHAIPLPNQSAAGNTDGFNVHTIALQLPISLLTAGNTTPTDPNAANAVIGVWSTANRPAMKVLIGDGTATHSGAFVQVSRLGNPLVNESVIPIGLKDRFNASQPTGDAQFLAAVQDPEPARLIDTLYPVDVPPAPRNDVVAVFLTGIAGANQPRNGPGSGGAPVPSEQLRLNVAIPPTPLGSRNSLGFLAGQLDGFPNGRRVGDDVVDIELRVLAGVLVAGFDRAPNNQLGDGVNTNDRPYLAVFPYLGTPASGYDSPHFMRRTTIREGQGTDPN